jgi:heme-degrading monooxygenase HmoA
MYGTVARLRIKPGSETQFRQTLSEFENLKIPGFISTHLYRMDADPNEYFMTVIFASKEAYQANAESTAQDARYRQMLASLDGEPVWHDGEITYGR